MRLYRVFNNDLLTQLTRSAYSVSIVDLKTGNPAFTADVANVALYKDCMNKLLSLAYKHIGRWRYDLITKKSIKLGTEVIALVDGTTHMGLPLS